MGEGRRFENDGAANPYAQDLKGVWHRRPANDPWIVSMNKPNAQAVCGAAIHSVHVSGFDPQQLHDFGAGGERACERCFAPGVSGQEWCLGAVRPRKVIHRRSCRHARTGYVWARQFVSPYDLAVALVNGGAAGWHRACQSCCGDLDDAIRACRDGALASGDRGKT